jgi:hypothetical protein
MMPRRFALYVVAIVAQGVSASSQTTEVSQEVLVRGTAAVGSGGLERARDAAIKDGMARAVEQVVGVFISTETRIEKEQLLESQVYARTQGFVSSYEVVREGKKEDMFEVLIKAQVSDRPLRQKLADLRLLRESMSNPRILLLYDGRQKTLPEVANTFEHELAGKFESAHFKIVDLDTSRRLRDEFVHLVESYSGREENVAATLGLDHIAEAVVLYSLRQARVENPSFPAFEVGVNYRVVNSTTAEIEASGSDSMSGPGGTPQGAAEEASKRLVGQVFPRMSGEIQGWWNEYSQNGVPHVIRLEGPSDNAFDGLSDRFMAALEQVAGVRPILRTKGGGYAEYSVAFRGDVGTLDQQVRKEFGGLGGLVTLHLKSARGRLLVFSTLK